MDKCHDFLQDANNHTCRRGKCDIYKFHKGRYY